MVRASLLAALLALLLPPTTGEAQHVPRIALVVSGPSACGMSPGSEAFIRRLGELGYAGTGVVVDRRCYTAIDEVPGLLVEILRLKPDVIVTGDSQAAVAAMKATSTTPIVTMNSSDPVQAGLIKSFARPGAT